MSTPTNTQPPADAPSRPERMKREAVTEAIEAAYWTFDTRRASAECSERDAFKTAVRRHLVTFFERADAEMRAALDHLRRSAKRAIDGVPSANAAIAEGQARRADGWLEVPGMAPVNAQEVRAIADARDRFRQERDAAHIRIRQAIHLLYNAMGQHHRGAADDGVRDAIGTLEPTGESASFEAATPNPAPMTLGHDGLLRPGAPSNVEGCPSNECQIRRQCTGTPCRMGSAMATSAAVRDANRAAAALAGHPDPVPLIEKMTKPQRVPVRATSGEVTGYRDGSSPDPVAQEAHAAGERLLREHAAREGISTATPPPDEHRLIIAQRMLVLADHRAQAGDHVGACECVGAYRTLLETPCPLPGAR